MNGIKGKRAIVTGAGQGIGFGIVKELLQAGAKVILNDLKDEFIQQAKKQLGHQDGLVTFQGDVSQKKVVNDLVSLAVKTFGGLDFAIANAGLTEIGPFVDFPEERLRRMLDLNMAGSFFLAQAAARQMISQANGGRILFLSSVTGIQGHPQTVGYGMTKAGINMLTKALGSELAVHRITVNSIAPGATLTERTLLEAGYAEAWGGVIPTGRASTPEDIAKAALFLLGPDSAQVTGQTLIVDGGWTNTSPMPTDII